ncbi:exported hypothetical protein [Candidatus Magnetomoraceae bacterium gMMP-15]
MRFVLYVISCSYILIILPSAGAADKPLKDIPKSISNMLIYESLIETISRAEIDLISFYLKKYDNKKFPQKERKIAERYISYCHQALKFLDCYQVFKFLNCKIKNTSQISNENAAKIKIDKYEVLLYDPRKIFIQMNALNKTAIKDCEKMMIIKGNQWNNFLVFYVRNVRKCSLIKETAWKQKLTGGHPRILLLFEIFNQKDYFSALDSYIQQYGFRKARGEIWTAIYFDYVLSAYFKGYINMALREFLENMVESDMKQFDYIKYLRNYLILLQREKIIR